MKNFRISLAWCALLTAVAFAMPARAELFGTTREFIGELKADGLKYSIIDESAEKNAVRLSFTGTNTSNIVVSVYLQKKSPREAELRVWNFVTVPPKKIYKVMSTLHDLNKKYKFCKFTFDSRNNTVDVEFDVLVERGAVGKICRHAVNRIVNIADAAYPTLMQAIWN